MTISVYWEVTYDQCYLISEVRQHYGFLFHMNDLFFIIIIVLKTVLYYDLQLLIQLVLFLLGYLYVHLQNGYMDQKYILFSIHIYLR